jgi:hypothetical protein
MGCFLSGIGVLSIIVGLSIVWSGPPAIQQIVGILFLGFGFVIIGLGGVVTAINDVSSILDRRLAIPQDPVVPTAEKESEPAAPVRDRERLIMQAQEDRARLLSRVRRLMGFRR